VKNAVVVSGLKEPYESLPPELKEPCRSLLLVEEPYESLPAGLEEPYESLPAWEEPYESFCLLLEEPCNMVRILYTRSFANPGQVDNKVRLISKGNKDKVRFFLFLFL
jgi:hypothetical protein